MRKWTETIAHLHNAGKYGSLGLLWAATTNMFFGIVNITATHWELASKILLIYGDLFVYSTLLLTMLMVLKNENYGRGLHISILLSIAWIGGAIY